MKNMKYSALMIDVVNSKRYENREEVQKYLLSIIKYVNKIYNKSLKKELMFSAGDEIQGLFMNPVAAYLCARFFMMVSYPVRVRASIGYGEITYDNDEWNSTEMDGSAYHNARYGIEKFHGQSSFGIMFNSNTGNDKIINSLLFASQVFQKKQSSIVHSIALISEIIFPIYEPRFMEQYNEDLEIIRDIFHQKNELENPITTFSIAGNRHIRENNAIYNLEAINNLNSILIPITAVFNEDELAITYVWKKGMSTAISEVLETSRQNIDKHVRFGQVEELRRIDFAIVYSLLEVFKNAE